jgi:ComF family protein
MWQNMQHFIDLFYPRLCFGCSRNLYQHELDFCWNCLHELPRTRLHNLPGNPLERLFWGRFEVEAVTSFLYFTKNGIAQNLLHRLKYDGAQQLGIRLGEMLGTELKQSNRFSGIDWVVPVPLHPKKEKLRGYNQSMLIARGVANGLQVRCSGQLLLRNSDTSSQTRKSRFERWENVSSAFVCPKPEKIKGKHILLVDDVLTTGATLEACALPLKLADGRVSMATIACALR